MNEEWKKQYQLRELEKIEANKLFEMEKRLYLEGLKIIAEKIPSIEKREEFYQEGLKTLMEIEEKIKEDNKKRYLQSPFFL